MRPHIRSKLGLEQIHGNRGSVSKLRSACDLSFRHLSAASRVCMGRAGTVRPVPTGTILLQHIQLLATHAELGEISDAAVYVEGNVIKWVGVTADLPADSQTADLVLDMKHRVVMPGMVNTHHHSEAPLTMHTPVDSSASCSPQVIECMLLKLTRLCLLLSGAGADAVHCSGEQLNRHITPCHGPLPIMLTLRCH